MEMHFEGFGELAGESEMESFASTFANVVLPGIGPPYAQMTERVDGSGAIGLSLYCIPGLGRWDESGFILDRADATYADGLSGVSSAAYSLMAVSDPVASAVDLDSGGSDKARSHPLLTLRGSNPTRGVVSFRLDLSAAGPVRVELVDARGARVAPLVHRYLPAGVHDLSVDLGRDLIPVSGGVYFLTARMGDRLGRQKVTLLR